MFRIHSCTDSATICGVTPQGKGREGKRKGKGAWLRFIHNLRWLGARVMDGDFVAGDEGAT